MGGKQLGFSDYELTTAKKQKWEQFLSQMEFVVPCQSMIASIEPHFPRADSKCATSELARPVSMGCEVGAFYWTVLAPDIVNPGREEQGSVSV
jgi:hypothetical protein